MFGMFNENFLEFFYKDNTPPPVQCLTAPHDYNMEGVFMVTFSIVSSLACLGYGYIMHMRVRELEVKKNNTASWYRRDKASQCLTPSMFYNDIPEISNTAVKTEYSTEQTGLDTEYVDGKCNYVEFNQYSTLF